MKWSTKRIVFTVLEILFIVIVPAVIILINYASWGVEQTSFKISLSGILLVILLLFVLKKVLLNKYIERLKATITQHMADLKIETEAEKKQKIANELKKERMIECILNFVLPMLLLALLFIVCKALETSVVKLSGAVGIIGSSEILGLVFSILESRCVEG